MNWQPIETAPKDGDEILICLPVGQSDHYRPMCWNNYAELWQDYIESEGPPLPEDTITSIEKSNGAWVSRYSIWDMITEKEIEDCHLRPMWCVLEPPPTSLCYVPENAYDHNH